MKICIVSSCGGHLTEIRALRSVYDRYEHFYVLNDQIILPSDMQDRTYYIRHSERDWVFAVNVLEGWRILRREKPTLILSTGAGPIVPFALVAKLLGIKCIFIETFARVTRPSMTGRIMYRLADRFFYQWKSLEEFFPEGVYGGPLA